jgi:hypothetical protein
VPSTLILDMGVRFLLRMTDALWATVLTISVNMSRATLQGLDGA